MTKVINTSETFIYFFFIFSMEKIDAMKNWKVERRPNKKKLFQENSCNNNMPNENKTPGMVIKKIEKKIVYTYIVFVYRLLMEGYGIP